MKLPCEIQNIVGTKPYKTEDIGKSGCDVLIFDDMVLKIGPAEGQPMKTQAELMKWLENKLSVPKCLHYSVIDGKEYMLMSKMDGKMACDEEIMADPYKLMDILADAMKKLWAVDVSACLVDMSLDYKLKMAEYNVQNGFVDVENTQQGTFGEGGFENPEALLEWLKSNRPDEDIVLSHGDLCLPNVFISNNSLSGFIDIDRMGKADKWNDIAICYRSLCDNYVGCYAAKKYDNFDADYLFKALGVEKDEHKLRYYILMDELF